MNPQVTNLVVMVVMMQLSRRIDMEDPTIVTYIRTAYVVSVVSSYLIYQLVKQKILSKNDTTELKIFTPKNPMNPNDTDKEETTTVRDYDLQQVESAIKSIYSGLAMMGFMHLYLKYTNPLFMQCINPIKSALEHNETKIHLFNHEATGELERPFKTANLMESLFGGQKQEEQEEAEKPKIEELKSE
ncbi:hypothetical protein KAFR_0D02730 [Kazachstania africana CBS 2517]|uniref:Inorganic phosphate transport protein PHO88 n=1 Tax=Kazachstania africana (strain ATCC 22294 / BCRC 22015 / CBS 2517 / CECT 1963 / NBRC 1671 / NRRL Y-8276) TaxID=1071382 RepID=H2AU71_KAZAF|nr:hypothetical protein KAFR_0D02730 [Kazachstania africana CBS 2517]CCF57921.1 hypothetical protein KAFR_0D02730 [Kazachstania africana CBS 2517]